jgi:hypothetical protein
MQKFIHRQCENVFHPQGLRPMSAKTVERPKTIGCRKAAIGRLVAKHELTELEASWLLKAWRLGGVAKMRDRFACYLAGFMAGIALKTVEQEVKARRN